MSTLPSTLLIGDLLEGYIARRFSPAHVMEHVLEQIAHAPDRRVWIELLPRERVLASAEALGSRAPESLPLYGIPFAIKDNIDVEGVPTTAACPDYSYVPDQSAHVVRRLVDAGAIPIGKTNLDQFATGLVGTRSPYGACHNSFDPAYISGGSSSGSAVAVATGLVSFSLGTDTAGSGRVPAAFNNLIGLKPSCGALSTSGVVPACRSLDCVSIFALTAADAARVYAAAAGYDADDPYSRFIRETAALVRPHGPFRLGVPRSDQLQFFGDESYRQLFAAAIDRLEKLGGHRVEVDIEAFLETARLLYGGPWIAERYCAVGEFLERHPQSVHPVTRELIDGGRTPAAADAFRAQQRLMALRRATERVWSDIDVLVTPTAGTIYRIAEVEADPIRLNSNLGYYTNFVNFLELAAVAAPAGFRPDGLPFGVTLVGRAGTELDLLRLAARLHAAGEARLGALGGARSEGVADFPGRPSGAPSGWIPVAVCGAHMEGLPLNQQLTSRGGYLLRRTRTAPKYRFYALPGGPPHRPGLVRVAAGGASIELEVWACPADSFGSFVAAIPAPLGIARIELEDGEQVAGFACEAYAVAVAEDITELGGWRSYLAARDSE